MKITEKNDWERLAYCLGDASFTKDNKTIKIHLKGRWVKFDIEWRDFVAHYSDHGHNYTVETSRPWVTIDYKGVAIQVPLMTFKNYEMKP